MFVLDQADLPIARNIAVIFGGLPVVADVVAQGLDHAAFAGNAGLNHPFWPLPSLNLFDQLQAGHLSIRMNQPMLTNSNRCGNELGVIRMDDFEKRIANGILWQSPRGWRPRPARRTCQPQQGSDRRKIRSA